MVTALDPHTALVIIDLQKGITAYPTVNPMANVLAQNAKLVAAFHKAGQPVVAVNVDPGKFKNPDARKDAPSHGRAELPADFLDIVPEIGTLPTDIFVTKHSWGAFFETGLHEILQAKGVTGIVLSGVSTSIGVEGTARQAAELGYNITFAKDAMTDMVASAQENSLNTIFPRIGQIDDTDAIIAKLS
ncbi:Nicotinamidase-related amidase [Chitinophaga costaii]|uniref:Nicotinamidase-related amidase n=1 Tax=Chitinophaga costaii TaxID=1335309 RepID=A0A1C4D8K4_9BACT|nr:isochorismatase family protein [Chitinophaga costaii]PUZ24503.1 hydrolase [Chitinophaga costaii]SCC27580.1 Nicotinamidase-related amidase [Chitinophaga costaii]